MRTALKILIGILAVLSASSTYAETYSISQFAGAPPEVLHHAQSIGLASMDVHEFPDWHLMLLMEPDVRLPEKPAVLAINIDVLSPEDLAVLDTEPQVRIPGPGGKSVAATPSIVSFRGAPSTETNPVATKTNNTCASDAYCTALVEPNLAGNGIIVFYTYTSGAQHVPTVFDCTTYGCTSAVDTFTACGSESGPQNTAYSGCFYTLTATTGSRNITVQWPTGVTNVSVSVGSIVNAPTFDQYATHTGTTTGTFTSGSVTPSQANDLVFSYVVMAAATMPTNVGFFTLGSQAGITWQADIADDRDATLIEHGVATGTSALNPQSSNVTATANYLALTVAFKSGSHGTAPTGMYIEHLYTLNTATAIGAGSVTAQMPIAGNLAAVLVVGGVLYPTAVSDATNGSWKSCGNTNFLLNNAFDNSYYLANISPGLLNVTMTTALTSSNVSGDFGPAIFADIVGANTAPVGCNRGATDGWGQTAASTFTSQTTYAPSSSAGISLFGGGVAFNTGIGMTAPSGGLFDLNTFGGESLSGPEPVDQNNMGGGHFNYTSNAASAVTWSLTSSSTAIQGFTSEGISFPAPGATLYPSPVKEAAHANDSGTTAKLTSYVPYQAGDVFAVAACTTATTGTIVVSDPTNGTYTAVDAAVNNNGVRCATFDKISASGSTVTITATFGTTATFTVIFLEEIANATTLDQHNLVASTATGNALNGTSVTTMSANEVLAGFALCNGNCDLSVSSPPMVNITTQGWSQMNYDGNGNASGYLTVSATGTYAVHFIETGSGSTDVTAIMTFH